MTQTFLSEAFWEMYKKLVQETCIRFSIHTCSKNVYASIALKVPPTHLSLSLVLVLVGVRVVVRSDSGEVGLLHAVQALLISRFSVNKF